MADHRLGNLTEDDKAAFADAKKILQEAEIAELAVLDRIEYDQRREEAAERLGVRKTTLDKAVAEYRKIETKAEAIQVNTPEPAAETVDGDSLLCEIADAYNRYLVLHENNAESVLALYTLHTYVFDAFDVLPYLIFTSPEKRCGKSTAMKLIHGFAHKSLSTSNISGPALFRVTEALAPTLLIDEADSFVGLNEELRGILNSGYTKSMAFVIRCEGDDHTPRQFTTWAPKCIAGIKSLPDTIEDRSIIIHMRRKRKDEEVARLRYRDLKEYEHIPGRCLR